MKPNTPDHPKTARLARALGVTRRDAVGLLEMLWIHAARFVKRGDIGKYDNEDIAKAVDWPIEDSDRLIDALLTCGGDGSYGYLELHDAHRLIVHDWAEHSPAYVRKALKRAGLEFVQTMSGQCPPNGGPSSPSPSLPSLPSPSPCSPPAKPKFKPEEVEVPSSLDTPEFRKSWVEWCGYRAKKRNRVSETAAGRQLTKLARAGPAAAVWAIEQSIANDYQGLFPEKHDGATKSKSRDGQVGKAEGGQYRKGDRVDA